MFNFFRKRRIKKYIEEASAYVLQKYTVFVQPAETKQDEPGGTPPSFSSGVRFSLKRTQPNDGEEKVLYSDRDDGVRYSLCDDQDDDIRYSDRETDVLCGEKDVNETPSKNVRYSLKEEPSEDHYNASAVSNVLRNYSVAGNYNEMLKTLEQNVNQTFVDRMLYYINLKGLRDSEVYKSAQVDKRLFSKIVSNNEYKPSKDTAIALAMALELSLDEANDLLSRAGYTFSHSNKRDIIIEFFFREKVYNLIDVNEVLYSLNQKLIGRF